MEVEKEEENEGVGIGIGVGAGVRVSLFGSSIENHFEAMDSIAELCGGVSKAEGSASFDDSEIRRLYSSITFLRDWRCFDYGPRTVRFNCGVDQDRGEGAPSGISLPQFSSATVPVMKEGISNNGTPPQNYSKDFVLHVGGSVWALDWCPWVHEAPNCLVNREFVAVAAHPPESYYHKIGVPLKGRGSIQIWFVPNIKGNEEDIPSPARRQKQRTQSTNSGKDEHTDLRKPRGRPRKSQIETNVTEVKRPRGRPRKMALEKHPADGSNSTQATRQRSRPRKGTMNDSIDKSSDVQCIQPLAIQYSRESSEVLAIEGIYANSQDQMDQKEESSDNDVKLIHFKKQKVRHVKRPIKESLGHVDCMKQSTEFHSIQHPSDLSKLHAVEMVSENSQIHMKQIEESQQNEANVSHSKKSTRQPKMRPRKKLVGPVDSKKHVEQSQDCKAGFSHVKKLKGQLKEGPITESLDFVDCDKQLNHFLALPNPLDSDVLLAADTESGNGQEKTESRVRGKSKQSSRKPSVDAANKNNLSRKLEDTIRPTPSAEDVLCESVVPNNAALPKMVLCMAHDGKVAWDVKWRPIDISDSNCQHRMGYLAVLLGDGSLEVWDVPLPHTMKFIHSSCQEEGIDPRFVQLEPVFRCSVLKCGEMQSIPLTVEWSTSHPHDYLLAGCHDGTVALWKFSSSGASREAKPLLCFSADTALIRAVAWAPTESDQESNVILTAGHGGLRFWDIRDPFRPLWDLHPVPRFTYSLDWLLDPSCVIISFDDGTMRLLSLGKAAYNAPVYEKHTVGPKQHGMHLIFNYSSFAIWSVHVSRLTGMVAYCGADGSACRFQLTSNAVDKDGSRNRAPHFVCGTITEDESAITISTPSPGCPVTLKKSVTDGGDGQRSLQFLYASIQAKRANAEKCPTSNDKSLTIYDGNDPGSESILDESVAPPKSKTKSGTKSGSKKNKGDENALVSMHETPEETQEKTEDGEPGMETEQIPSKLVAIHRVRWNMNKGSERWLCYGGAAGIVRCHEIIMSDIDKKMARKR